MAFRDARLSLLSDPTGESPYSKVADIHASGSAVTGLARASALYQTALVQFHSLTVILAPTMHSWSASKFHQAFQIMKPRALFLLGCFQTQIIQTIIDNEYRIAEAVKRAFLRLGDWVNS